MPRKRSPKEKEGIQVKVDGTGTPYWAGFYWELAEPGKKNPPTAVLSRDMDAPAWELSALREREKPKVMKRLGLTSDVSDKTISKLSREWLDDEVHPDNGKNSLKTWKDYKRTILYYIEACGDHPIEQYSYEHEKQFKRWLRDDKGLGNAQRTYQVQFGVFLNWVNLRHPVGRKLHITRNRAISHVIETLTRDEIEDYKEFIFGLGDPIAERVWMLAYYAMMRSDEINAITWSNINLKRAEISISPIKLTGWKPKQLLPRKIPIGKKLLAFLKREREKSSRDTFYLQKDGGGQYYSDANNLSQRFMRLKDQAGIGDVDMLQILRRSGITILVESGEALQDVHRWAGHKRIETTMKYYLNMDVMKNRKGMDKL